MCSRTHATDRVRVMADEDPAVDAWRGLLVAHSRLVPAVEADLRAAGQIPLSWYDVLLELNAAPERRLRMSELGQRVVLSRTRVSRIVDELAAAGLAERQPDQAGGRADHTAVPRAGRAARPGDQGRRGRASGTGGPVVRHQPASAARLSSARVTGMPRRACSVRSAIWASASSPNR